MAIRVLWKRLRLSQVLEQRARKPEVCGFESFGEAVVDEGERMAGLIALPVFGKHARQSHRGPQLPGEGRLRACDSERFGQAVQGGFTVMLCRENLRFDPKQFG